MNVLLHMCCGPCSVAVLEWLLGQGHEVTGFFFNPNIQPLAEYMRRREAAEEAARLYAIPIILADTLPWEEQVWNDDCLAMYSDGEDNALLEGLPPAVHPVPWLRMIHGREFERCPLCWASRLRKTADFAVSKGFEAFTSTLLYSRYQNHAVLYDQCTTLAKEHSLTFIYHDFREFWQKGIERSKELHLYRQPYCGCMLSEYERYAKKFRKRL